MTSNKLRFLISQRKHQISAIQREINSLIIKVNIDFVLVRELINKQLSFRNQMRAYQEDLKIIEFNEEGKSI